MFLGIISDTHGSLTAWNRAIEGPLADSDLLVHAGDVFYHGTRNPMPEGYDTLGLADAIMAYPKPIVIVQGNCDSEVDQMVLNIPIVAPFAELMCGGHRVFVQHWQRGGERELADMLDRFRPRVFVTGHTHVPELRVVGDTLIVNPGSPSLTKHPAGRKTVARAQIDGNGQVLTEIVDVDSGETLDEFRIE